MTAAVTRRRGAGREQLLETARRLFARDGVEATSLQDIADEMGVTKAGVYYHYKTKDELVLDVLGPLLDALPDLAARVEAQRTRHARVEEMLNGFVDLAVGNHSSFTVAMIDPYVIRLLSKQRPLQQWWDQIVELVTGPEPDTQTRVALLMFIGGLTSATRDAWAAEMAPEAQREYLLECGRRLLQHRRRTTNPGSATA
jgi:AcrR family transcriptional regulator